MVTDEQYKRLMKLLSVDADKLNDFKAIVDAVISTGLPVQRFTDWCESEEKPRFVSPPV
jgi:hypothetical protein